MLALPTVPFYNWKPRLSQAFKQTWSSGIMTSVKVTFRTLKGASFTLSALESETILDLKRKVAAHQNTDDYAGYRLIHKGKILSDDVTISAAAINSSGFVVVMPPKKSAVKPSAPKPSASKPISNQNSPLPSNSESAKTPKTIDQPKSSVSAPSSTAVPQSSQPETGNAENSLVVGSEYDESVRRICEMGFTEDVVKRAMRAAFNNPDRAVEFIFNGIPEAAANPTVQSSDGRTTDSDSNPVNMGSSGDRNNSNLPPSNTLDQQPSRNVTGQRPSDGSDSRATPNLDVLRDAPIFNQIRRLIRANPAALPQLLQYIEAANPTLMSLIEANQEEFSRLINEPVPEGDEVTDEALEQLAQAFAGSGGSIPHTTQDGRVYVTEEEREQIARLTELASNFGVSEGQVLQSWVACNRDEDLTANYLVDNADELRDDQAEDSNEGQRNNPTGDSGRSPGGPP